MKYPVNIIGIGDKGTGKSQLQRCIFASENSIKAPSDIAKVGVIKSTTRIFSSFIIERSKVKVQFTDGSRLGEDLMIEEQLIQQWIKEIPNHNLLY